MIRLRRYLVALSSLVAVLFVGHLYVNRAVSFSAITPAELRENTPTISEKWTNISIPIMKSTTYNYANNTSTVTAVSYISQMTVTSTQSSSTSYKTIEPFTPSLRTKNKIKNINHAFPMQMPVGNAIRPYVVDPVKYAIRMARIRLLIEVYGSHAVREARQRSNGDLLLPPIGTARKQIIVVSYWRSGSSFLGDLLNHIPATFYHFEPLHSLTFNRFVSTEAEQTEAIRLLSSLIRCEFDDLEKYLLWSRQKDNQFLFTHNHRLWTACRIRTSLCFDPNFLSSLCNEHPVQLSKVVRLPLNATKKLLRENPHLKVVYLLRDPRGMFSSRLGLDWCNQSIHCIDPDVACGGIRRDLAAAQELKAEFPTRFTALRYEDLALEPEIQTQELFKFLDFEMTRQVMMFLRANTRARGKDENWNPYSTRRDSKSTALKWRHKLSFTQVEAIQNSCSDVIREIGFDLITSKEELRRNSSSVT